MYHLPPSPVLNHLLPILVRSFFPQLLSEGWKIIVLHQMTLINSVRLKKVCCFYLATLYSET